MEEDAQESVNVMLRVFFNATNGTSPSTFSTSHRLLDVVTYTFCVVGILLNFFAFGILRRKATMGVLLIKLILISDGLVCIFYLLNQIWTDITLTYLLSALITEYLSRKSSLIYVSNVFRILAVAAVSVSNWYIVIMIAHRCISIYVSPRRSRLDHSLWVFVQKHSNLWVAYALCWFCSILITLFPHRNHQLLLEVIIFVLPLTLVFIFSVSLLIKLRIIHRSSGSGNRSSLCCPHPRGANKSAHKVDSDDTFARTKEGTVSLDEPLGPVEEHRRKGFSRKPREAGESNFKNKTKCDAIERRKTYYRITMTILSLAISFLILDSLQFLDLLIRIPWRNILGSIEERHVNASISPKNASDMGKFLTEVQQSGEKQSVLSIVKNTCTLGKTLANFLILCAHSKHFRTLVSIRLKRSRRFIRLLRNRIYPRLSRPVNTARGIREFWVVPSMRRITVHRKRTEKEDYRDPSIAGSNSTRRPQYGVANCPSSQRETELRKSSSPRSSLTRSIFRARQRDDEGYVVHKFHRPLRKAEFYKNFPHMQPMYNRRPMVLWNGNVGFFRHEKQAPQSFLRRSAITGGHCFPNDPSTDTAKYPFPCSSTTTSSSYQPTSNSTTERGQGSESGKSCCTTCDCRSVYSTASSPPLSLVSNLTYPGAFRTHCCDCHRSKITQTESKPPSIRE